ncbi:MAG: polyisoprenyl-teichoic acid--peptidoglycan teichoic acid transferase [Clostridia bacterium]|nr:polyisoprenyl-teichoic acid--peptidoglycan teichoic acid transferase [Clostridia bacterium]
MTVSKGQYQVQQGGSARAKRRRRQRFFTSALGLFLLAILIFSTFAFAGYLGASIWMDNVLANNGDLDEGGDGKNPSAKKPETILLIGVDQRNPNEPCRSDTIMLVALDPGKQQVDLISIPRDTRVKIPGYGYDKINAAHAYGGKEGPELLMDTINNLLGIKVDKYVKVNFQGFQKIIDILGGVDINVDKRMYYPQENIDLYPGPQHLNGYDALAYVRYRYDPEGDITRVGRQQKFIKALVDQTLQLSTIPKIPQLVSQISKEVDTNLSVKEMLTLALSMKDINGSGSIKTHMLPGEGKYIGEISYYVLDPVKLTHMLTEIPNLR